MGNTEHRFERQPSKQAGGREAINTEEALSIQINLAKLMTPTELEPYVNYNNENDPVGNAVVMHWMEKYALGEFNGLQVYCNNYADEEFINRAQSASLTEADYEELIEFLTISPQGREFFTNDELAVFMKENNLSPLVLH